MLNTHHNDRATVRQYTHESWPACTPHVAQREGKNTLNRFRTAVPFWGQSTQILSSLSPLRDCSPNRGKAPSNSESYISLELILREVYTYLENAQ